MKICFFRIFKLLLKLTDKTYSNTLPQNKIMSVV